MGLFKKFNYASVTFFPDLHLEWEPMGLVGSQYIKRWTNEVVFAIFIGFVDNKLNQFF